MFTNFRNCETDLRNKDGGRKNRNDQFEPTQTVYKNQIIKIGKANIL